MVHYPLDLVPYDNHLLKWKIPNAIEKWYLLSLYPVDGTDVSNKLKLLQ